jgi:hypothetical protein
MLSRNATTINQVSQRAAAMRRQMHRHSWGRPAGPALYCPTNGCATFMEVDEARHVARCPICGAQRRVR